ncbi:MAG: hypothetical protein NZM25_00050 [Leptospiraceae bacterium]|nr:hypothetical protein [Leptospiraceae bacterium]MDW8307568.1 hypothetical protein [Leptospiraceae bacterium]
MHQHIKCLWLSLGVILFHTLSCSQRAETPEQAFEMLRDAYMRKDAAKFVQLLTPESIQGIEKMIEPIRMAYLKMADDEKKRQKAFEPMAKKIGVPVSRLGSLTVEEYIAIIMGSDESEGKGADTTFFPKELLQHQEILSREIEGDRAILYFAENRKLQLRKTKKGWLIDLDLSLPDPNYYPSPD